MIFDGIINAEKSIIVFQLVQNMMRVDTQTLLSIKAKNAKKNRSTLSCSISHIMQNKNNVCDEMACVLRPGRHF